MNFSKMIKAFLITLFVRMSQMMKYFVLALKNELFVKNIWTIIDI